MDDRPHILFLIDHLWAVAGAEGALLRTARLLPQSRYRCSIGAFCVNPDLAVLKTFPWPVTEFRFDGKLNAQSIRTALQFRRFIRSQRVDIVHTFLESANIWGGLFACLSGCPVLISTRRDLGILRSGKHRLAYRLLNPLVDQVQAVSRAARDHTIRSEKLTPNKVVVIPNGIDMPQPGTDANRRDLVKSLGLKENCRVVISVANIRRVKGIDVLIRAAQQVCREYPETVFLVAGAVNEPDYYSELKALTAQLKLSDNVRFLGQRSDVQSLLHLSEIFCLLSRSEGMSNALL